MTRKIKSIHNKPFASLLATHELAQSLFVTSRYDSNGKSKGKTKEAIRREIRLRDKVCRYCIENPAESVDHVIPLSRGGKDSRDNMVGCCIPCNLRKGNQTPEEAGMPLLSPVT